MIIPDTICSDPKDPRFFEGASLETLLSMLKHVAPEKHDWLGVFVRSILRREFLTIGPDPKKVRGVGIRN